MSFVNKINLFAASVRKFCNFIASSMVSGKASVSCKTQRVSDNHYWAIMARLLLIIFLDFANAFDSVPHIQLLVKAEYNGVRRKLLMWLQDFLMGRRQRIVANGFFIRLVTWPQACSTCLEKWTPTWQMHFSSTKCYRMSVTLKRSLSSLPYTLYGTVLEGVTHQKYLGVYSLWVGRSKHKRSERK